MTDANEAARIAEMVEKLERLPFVKAELLSFASSADEDGRLNMGGLFNVELTPDGIAVAAMLSASREGE